MSWPVISTRCASTWLVGPDGLVGAAVASGAGWLPTYRADRWCPPLIQIDDVFVIPGIDADTVETVRVRERISSVSSCSGGAGPDSTGRLAA